MYTRKRTKHGKPLPIASFWPLADDRAGLPRERTSLLPVGMSQKRQRGRHRQCDGQQETARRRSLIRKESFPSDVNLDGKIGAYPIRLPSLQSLSLKFSESWIFTN